MKNQNFLVDAFLSAFQALKVSNASAQQVLSHYALSFLKEESVNAQAMQSSLQSISSIWPKQVGKVIVHAESDFSAALIHTLKMQGLNVCVANHVEGVNGVSNRSGFRQCDEGDIFVEDIVSNQTLANQYTQLLSQHRQVLERKLIACVTADHPVVVFTAKKVYFNQLRLSKVLRDKGYKTIAIVFDRAMTQHQSGFFDEVIYTDLLSFLLCLNKFDKNILLHTQGWLFRYHIPVLIDMYKSDRCKQIIEMMDSQSLYLPESVVKKIPDSLKRAWGDNVLEKHYLQLACENYIVHHSDGVIFNGDDTYRDPLVKRDSECLRNKHLSFPALPLKDFFSVSHEVNQHKKLVFVGGIPPMLSNRPYELFGDSQLLSLVTKLIENGCHLDIYNNPLIASEADYRRLYPEYIQMAEDNERFNFFAGDMPHLINQIIAKYDIGLMVYDFCGIYTGDLHFKHLIPTKLFNYLEAGLPVLVSARFEAVCSLIKEYGIGVIIDDTEIDYLPQIVEMLDVAKLKKNVLAAREELQMHNNIHRLTGFYEQIAG